MNLRFLLPLLGLAAWAASGHVTVTVEQAKVRKAKAFYSTPVATVVYQDTLAAGEPEDGWVPVTVRGGKKGWLHESAVGAKSRKLRAGTWEGGDEATQDEVTLAGKGFNADVEKSYRSGDAGNYEAVDAMERRAVTDAQLLSFMRSGKTLPKGAR